MFKIVDAQSLEDLKSGNLRLVPMLEAICNIKEIHVTDKVAEQIREGKQIRKSDLTWLDMEEFEAGEKLKICKDTELVSVAQALVGTNDKCLGYRNKLRI